MSQTPDSHINDRIRRNIESVAQLELAFERRRTAVDRVSDAVSAFGGSVRFVVANAVLLTGWVLWNLLAPARLRFDPNFAVLELVIAVEALFLSAFVLMSQNRQKRQAEHWAHVDLQISLLAEQESTKMLQTMQNICRFLGMEKAGADPELKQLSEQVPVARLAEEVGKTLLPEEVAVREIAAVLAEEERKEEEKTPPNGPAPSA